jgi:O-antigen/teichoic acid export membrane protein
MLIYQTLLYLPAQLLGPAFQLLAAVAWTHFLSPSEYGVLALVIVSQELIFYLCLYWWSQYATRYYAAHQQDQTTGRYQPTENAVLIGNVALQTVAASLALALTDAAWDGALMGATIAFIVTRSLNAHLAERARACGNIGAYTVAQTMGPVLGCLIGFAAIIEGEASAAAVLAGFALAQTLALPLLWRMLGLGTAAWLDRGILGVALRFGSPLLGAAVVAWLSVNGLRVIVDKLEGAAAVGLVSVGWSLGQRAASVAAMLVTAAAYPLAVSRAVTHSRAAALAQLSQSGALLLGIIAPVTAGLLIVNQTAVELLIGSEFQSVTLAVLPIAVLSGAVRNLRLHYADQTFLLCERTGVALLVCAVEALLTVPLCVLGLVKWGLVGACMGCLIAHTLAALLSIVIAVRGFLLPIPYVHVGKIALATLLMAVLLAAAPWPPTRLGLSLEVLAGGLAYLVAVALLYRRGLRALVAALRPVRAEPAGPR